MDQDQFNKLTKQLIKACKDALGMKAGEYAREGDRLHNFYAAARKRDKHPLDSLLSMQVKHRVSIDDICDDIINRKKFPTDEMMLEKFKDDINYNLLAFALIHELREKARKEVFANVGMRPPGWNCRCVVGNDRERIKKFRESLCDLGKISFSATFQPHGTISRAEAEKTERWLNVVTWQDDLYLPVHEEKYGYCIGCFFQEDIKNCNMFREALGLHKHDFCEHGVIWLKVV